MALADLTVLNRRTAGPRVRPRCCRRPACSAPACARYASPSRAAHDQPHVSAADAAGLRTLCRRRGAMASCCSWPADWRARSPARPRSSARSSRPGAITKPRSPKHAKALRPWMQRLLQDTKEIRSEYVVSLGSATYGSLVRRLLGGPLTGPTLLIGAGQLAETILPFLDGGEVLVWNRSRERSAAMLSRQRAARHRSACSCWSHRGEAEDAAWRRAQDVVVCIPGRCRARRATRAAVAAAWPCAPAACCTWASTARAGTAWAGMPRAGHTHRPVRAARYPGLAARTAAGPRTPRLPEQGTARAAR